MLETIDRALEKTKLELKKEIDTSKVDLKKGFRLLREEIHKAGVEIRIWIAGMLIVQTAIIVTLIKYL